MKNRIAELRKEKKMTLKELGEALGIRDNTLSQYETGKRTPRNPELWEKLASYFGVSVAYIMGIEEEPHSLEDAIVQYVNEIMSFEIKQGDQKYKLLYDPGHKQDLLNYLYQQDWDGLTIRYGVRYETKALMEEYLFQKEILGKYTNPYSDENAIRYVQEELLHSFKKNINSFFAIEEVDLKRTSYLKEDQIKSELSFKLYKEIIRNLDKLNIELNQFES